MTSQLVSSSSFTWQQSNVSSALAHNSHCEQSLASLRVASHAETSAEQCDSGVANSLKPYVDLVNIPVALELGDGQIRSRSRVSRIHTVNVRDVFSPGVPTSKLYGALALTGELAVFDSQASIGRALNPLVPQVQASAITFASASVMSTYGISRAEHHQAGSTSPQTPPLTLPPTEASSTSSRTIMAAISRRVSESCEIDHPPTISRCDSRRLDEVFEGVGELDTPYELGSCAASGSLAVRRLIDGSTRRFRSVRGSKSKAAAARARPRVQDIFAPLGGNPQN